MEEKTLAQYLKDEINDSNVKGKSFDVFKKVATKLMSEYAIKKGDDYYQMVEIEFYWYSHNHPDLSVYPRNSKVGNWYLHPSGVDITLESCVKNIDKLRQDWEFAKNKQENEENYPKDCSYGGILIRTLRKFKPEDNDNQYNKKEENNYINGPWKCCDKLFDYLPCNGKSEGIGKMLPEIIHIEKEEMMPDLEKEMEK